MEKKTEFPDFDSIAQTYDFLKQTVFGSTLIEASSFFCRYISPGASVLSLGGGSGKLEAEQVQNTDFQLIYVESSAKMAAIARARSTLKKAEFIVCREENLPELPPQDVLFTHFFLDNFSEEEIGPVFQRCAGRLRSGGLWFVSDFRIAHESLHRFWQKPFLRLMYLFFRLSTGLQNQKIPEIEARFAGPAWELLDRKTFWKGFIFTAVYRKTGD